MADTPKITITEKDPELTVDQPWKTKTKKYKAGGPGFEAAGRAAGLAIPAIANIAMQQGAIRDQRKRLRGLRKELKQPSLTAEDIAASEALAGAGTREAGAFEARGGAGGKRGMDRSRFRRQQQAALAKQAQMLSAAQSGRLAKHAQLADLYSKERKALEDLRAERRQTIVKGLSDLMTDKKLTELRKKAGETVDRPKDVEKKKTFGKTITDYLEKGRR